MKKLFNYYCSIINKFGSLVTSLVILLPLFALTLAEAGDAPTAFLEKSVCGFVVVAILMVALLAGFVFAVVKFIKVNIVSIMDLALIAFTALAILVLLLLCFNPGNGTFISVLKWITAPVVLVASAVAAYFRSKSI